MNLETLSTRVLEAKLGRAAFGSREEMAIRNELRRRQIEEYPVSKTGTPYLPFPAVSIEDDPPYKR